MSEQTLVHRYETVNLYAAGRHLLLDLGLELELLVHARIEPVVELALGARV
jgi:hypothetical protein